MVVQIDDRRVFDRFMARFPVKYNNSRNGYGSEVFLRDISAQGAKIASKREIRKNDNIELSIELPDGHDPMLLRGNIAWARDVHPGAWDAGIRFEKIDFMKTQRIYKYCQA